MGRVKNQVIKFERVGVYNLENAILGIRNSWDSHAKSDSTCDYIGDNDKKLALKLNKAGASHAKYLRQIMVSVNITAPLFWWKQFDQYKVGTTTNSESTMHTINRVGFINEEGYDNVDMFSMEFEFLTKFEYPSMEAKTYEGISIIFETLENLRLLYNKTKDKRYWDLLIALLPSGFNQMRTTTMNYAVLANIYHDRKHHKLTEWHEMCDWIKTLPYSELITGDEK